MASRVHKSGNILRHSKGPSIKKGLEVLGKALSVVSVFKFGFQPSSSSTDVTVASFRDITGPEIARTTLGSDLVFDITNVLPGVTKLISNTTYTSADSEDFWWEFIQLCTSLGTTAYGLLTSGSDEAQDSEDPIEDLIEERIFTPALQVSHHLDSVPNLRRNLLAASEAVWKFLYLGGTEKEFTSSIKKVNKSIKESLRTYSEFIDSGLDITSYGQIQLEHFKQVRKALDGVTTKLQKLTRDSDGETIRRVITACSKQLARIESSCQTIGSTSGSIADLVFSSPVYLARQFKKDTVFVLLDHIAEFFPEDRNAIAKFLAELRVHFDDQWEEIEADIHKYIMPPKKKPQGDKADSSRPRRSSTSSQVTAIDLSEMSERDIRNLKREQRKAENQQPPTKKSTEKKKGSEKKASEDKAKEKKSSEAKATKGGKDKGQRQISPPGIMSRRFVTRNPDIIEEVTRPTAVEEPSERAKSKSPQQAITAGEDSEPEELPQDSDSRDAIAPTDIEEYDSDDNRKKIVKFIHPDKGKRRKRHERRSTSTRDPDDPYSSDNQEYGHSPGGPGSPAGSSSDDSDDESDSNREYILEEGRAPLRRFKQNNRGKVRMGKPHIRGWNWQGGNAKKVAVEWIIGEARTGRVEPGTWHPKEAFRADMNIAANNPIQTTRSTTTARPKYKIPRVKYTGLVYWDARDAPEDRPYAVLTPSSCSYTVYPTTYMEVSLKNGDRPLIPRWLLPKLLCTSEINVARMIYRQAVRQEKHMARARGTQFHRPEAVSEHEENSWSRHRRRQKAERYSREAERYSDSDSNSDSDYGTPGRESSHRRKHNRKKHHSRHRTDHAPDDDSDSDQDRGNTPFIKSESKTPPPSKSKKSQEPIVEDDSDGLVTMSGGLGERDSPDSIPSRREQSERLRAETDAIVARRKTAEAETGAETGAEENDSEIDEELKQLEEQKKRLQAKKKEKAEWHKKETEARKRKGVD